MVGLLAGCDQAPSPQSLQSSTGTASKFATQVSDRQSARKRSEPAKRFRLFTIDSVRKEGASIQIVGSTDLPNGTYVTANVAFKSRRGDDDILENNPDGKNAWSEVKNGKWQVDLDAPVAPAFYKEQHMVTADGELGKDAGIVDKAISGDEDDGSFYTQKNIWIEERADASSVSASSQLPRPKDYPADSPGRAVAEVIGDWKRHDWHDMARWEHGLSGSPATDRIVARGERRFHELPVADRVKACKSAFHSWEVREARIGDVDVDADPQFPIDNAQVTVHLKTSFGGEEKDVDTLWVVLKPDSKSRWGVAIETAKPN